MPFQITLQPSGHACSAAEGASILSGAPAMIDASRRDFTARGLPEEEFIADAFTFANKTQ